MGIKLLETQEGSKERLRWYKGVGLFLASTLVVGGIGVGGIIAYKGQVLYPSRLKVDESSTGIYAIKKWQRAVNSYNKGALKGYSKNEYLVQEEKYQNENEDRINFIKSALKTVKYTALEENVKNKYGGEYYLYNSKNKTESGLSSVNFGEKVKVSYIDYDSLEFDSKDVAKFLEKNKISLDDPDLKNTLTDAFCRWVSQMDEIPTKSEKRSVPLNKEGDGFKVDVKEDETLDEALFSSKEFYSALDRFSEAALGDKLEKTEEYKKYEALPEDEKKKTKEPEEKYNTRLFIPHDWIGIHSLMYEGVSKGEKPNKLVFADGKGTIDSPANVGTPVVVSHFVKGEDGKTQEIKLRVTLESYSLGSDAIVDLINKDNRNRGIDSKSSTKYIYATWKVENLSNLKFTLEENSSLADKEGNISAKTGVMYGLGEVVEIGPYETTEFQTWSSSTELAEKYLIWGRDYDRRTEPVWFKVLKLSGKKVTIPDEDVYTKDIFANKNKKATETDE